MQAVEAKEGVEIQNETITLASISYQNFFRSYKKKSGMTGTAATETAELSDIYDLTVSVCPPNRPNVRKDNSDVVFRSTEGEILALPLLLPYVASRVRSACVSKLHHLRTDIVFILGRSSLSALEHGSSSTLNRQLRLIFCWTEVE